MRQRTALAGQPYALPDRKSLHVAGLKCPSQIDPWPQVAVNVIMNGSDCSAMARPVRRKWAAMRAENRPVGPRLPICPSQIWRGRPVYVHLNGLANT
jgi:hypothetical protein